jgi:hypothetical protein
LASEEQTSISTTFFNTATSTLSTRSAAALSGTIFPVNQYSQNIIYRFFSRHVLLFVRRLLGLNSTTDLNMLRLIRHIYPRVWCRHHDAAHTFQRQLGSYQRTNPCRFKGNLVHTSALIHVDVFTFRTGRIKDMLIRKWAQIQDKIMAM